MAEKDRYSEYGREQLVEEYLETRLATFVDVCGVDRRWMPFLGGKL